MSGAPTPKPLPLGYGEAMLTIGPGRTRASFHQSRSFRITDATLPGWASANIASCRSPIGISSLVKIVGRSCRRPCGKAVNELLETPPPDLLQARPAEACRIVRIGKNAAIASSAQFDFLLSSFKATCRSHRSPIGSAGAIGWHNSIADSGLHCGVPSAPPRAATRVPRPRGRSAEALCCFMRPSRSPQA